MKGGHWGFEILIRAFSIRMNKTKGTPPDQSEGGPDLGGLKWSASGVLLCSNQIWILLKSQEKKEKKTDVLTYLLRRI